MCLMLARPQTPASRGKLRDELAAFLIDRSDCPRLVGSFTILGELEGLNDSGFSEEESCDDGIAPMPMPPQCGPAKPIPATADGGIVRTELADCDDLAVSEEVIAAIKWALGLCDTAHRAVVLLSLIHI